ncbi:MAG: glycerol-3-phosphate acyltransferase [Aggregatilineales bacterium]
MSARPILTWRQPMITDATILQYLFIILMGYLIGSIPTAYMIARLHNINIFDIGSGNMGGTNIARTLGAFWGVLTSVIDIFKGMLAILLARLILPEQPWAATSVAALAVICGHNWSIFATLLYSAARRSRKFTIRGGKGAATAFGTMVMVAPPIISVVMLLMGALLVYKTRYMSLAVLTTFFLASVGVVLMVAQQLLPPEYLIYVAGILILLPLRFRENIQRLISGTERRVGDRVQA